MPAVLYRCEMLMCAWDLVPRDKSEWTVRYGTVRYGTVRYGTVRYGTVRYGTVRYGTVRYGMRHRAYTFVAVHLSSNNTVILHLFCLLTL